MTAVQVNVGDTNTELFTNVSIISLYSPVFTHLRLLDYSQWVPRTSYDNVYINI